MNRRSLLWSIPAIGLATSAPAFATSTVTDPEVCDKPLGWRKLKKGNPAGDTYFLNFVGCDDPKDVKIFDHSRKKWIDAVKMSPYHWSATGFRDDRIARNVYVDGEQFVVSFPITR